MICRASTSASIRTRIRPRVSISIRKRLRYRVGFASLILLLAPGCSLSNPGFDGSSASESAGSNSSTETATSPGTSGTVSTAASSTGSESDGSSSGALTLTEGSSTGTTTETTTDTATGTTSDTATGSSSGSSSTGTSSTGADTEGSTGESAGPEPMTLHNYSSLQSCKTSTWCKDKMGNNPVPAQHRTAECFESPIEPPFMVTKLTVYPHKILGTPEVAVRVFEYDQQNQALGDLLVSQSAGTVSPGLNAKVLTFDPPFTVMEPTFCVGYESAPGETQLAVKVDTTANISGLSVLWIFNNDDCEVGPEPLTELYKDAPNPRFCMDVEIVAP